MTQISAVIVEDEKPNLNSLVKKIERSCPLLSIVGCSQTVDEAIAMIHEKEPELVFLDVRLGTQTGFDVLKSLKHIDFYTIFTTNYQEYAIKAIKAEALDYILKPIDESELIEAVHKAWEKIKRDQSEISVPTSKGERLIKLDTVTYFEADDNFTKIHGPEKRPIMVCRTLLRITDQLPEERFFRNHRKYTVNKLFIQEYTREEGGMIILIPPYTKKLPISRPRKAKFLAWFHSR